MTDGYAFHVPAGAFVLVAAFVEAERRCCPFLTFGVDVLPGATAIILRITGCPEARAIIVAELPLS
jgi:hypothetical protein